MEKENQVIDGASHKRQFEPEARQQWEQCVWSVESLVDEASSYCYDQSTSLRARTDTVIKLEARIASAYTRH